MISFARKIDIPDMKKLWRECFNEDGDFFFERMFARALVFDDGGMRAMLHILEYTCLGKKVFYLYGIGTTKVRRGEGIARKLIEYAIELAKNEGVSFLMLVPQEESLFKYYKRFGFEKLCGRSLPKNFAFNMRRANKFDIFRLNMFYEEKCKGKVFLTRENKEWEIILDEGYEVYISDEGYVIKAGDKILETNLPCEYEEKTDYAAFLKLSNINLSDGYFNILHD